LKSEIEVYVMNIADILNQPIEKYLHFFSRERQKNILRYKFNADRNRTIFAELLVRSVIAKKISQLIEKIFIDRDENGKPFVVGNFFEISLSHCENWVACSLGDVPNGVDIESDSRDALEIAKNFFTAEEYKNLCALNSEERKLQFLKYWTLKESCFKCTGDLIFDENFGGKNFILSDGAVLGIYYKKIDFSQAKVRFTNQRFSMT